MSFPNVFEDDRELEGFYRLLRNDNVDGRKLMAPHVRNTVERVEKTEGPVLCLHDTTTFTFEGRENLGIIEGKIRGFLAHCSLAVRQDGVPLGGMRIHAWQRDANRPTPTKLRKMGMPQHAVRKMPSEMDRWGESIMAVEDLMERPGKLIHVADSEGDDYRLLSQLTERGCRYVVRGCYDRQIISRGGEHTFLTTRILVESPVANRSVKIAARPAPKTKKPNPGKRNLPREGRTAELEIRAVAVSIKRPKLSAELAATVGLNVVHVVETAPPEGQVPIEWTLLTGESIDTPEAILTVVDMYRKRWIVEEFFKALKTGCAYETRQLESFTTFTNALAIFVPVAWRLLRLRALERTDSNLPVEECFTSDQVFVLRAKSRHPIHTVSQALAAIARMGGHIRNNGRPGWLVLWRGLRDLLLLAYGVAIGRRSPPICDQS
jgi:IS4 transposase